MLATLVASRKKGEYVFCTLNNEKKAQQRAVIDRLIAEDTLEMYFKEKEGITIIVEKSVADSIEALTYEYVAAWLEIKVHSSLDAVGLTAAFSAALGDAGISANVVAAYFHDHIFVASRDADRAVRELDRLRERSKRGGDEKRTAGE
eukprot:g2403.t1